MTTVSITPATEGQQKQVIRLVQDVTEDTLRGLNLTKDGAQCLLGKGGGFKAELARALGPIVQRFSTPNIVVVPDISAVELTAATKRDLKLTCLDGDYANWDFYKSFDGQPIEGRGQRFEALVWKPEIGPDDVIASEQIRAYFRERGFTGHTGAFTQWRRQNPGLMGYHASIPVDRGCWRDSDGYLGVPYSDFGDGYRRLRQYWFDDDWDDDWSFVAFRVVS